MTTPITSTDFKKLDAHGFHREFWRIFAAIYQGEAAKIECEVLKGELKRVKGEA